MMAPYIDVGPSRFKCTLERKCCSACRREHDAAKRRERATRKVSK